MHSVPQAMHPCLADRLLAGKHSLEKPHSYGIVSSGHLGSLMRAKWVQSLVTLRFRSALCQSIAPKTNSSFELATCIAGHSSIQVFSRSPIGSFGTSVAHSSRIGPTPWKEQLRDMATITREWYAPEAGEKKQELVLYNSLLDEKVPFIPAAGAHSKQITWYTCGPTVYDSAHLGHARNYVTFDILRRVLEDYFGYNVQFVMNVTDVDDKIILRARRNYVLQKFHEENADQPEKVRAYAIEALQAAIAKQAQKVKEAQDQVPEKVKGEAPAAAKRREELKTAAEHELLKQSNIQTALDALQQSAAQGSPSEQVSAMLSIAADWVAEAVDKERGADVKDPSIYRAHAQKYEREFMEDMDTLGCRRADVLTRVSEYIEEIVTYIQTIINNGCAYESNGSVYFDTAKFRACGHTYGKLKPWAVGSAALASEGEADFTTSEKRNANDFALWKAAKRGEPTWPSPWGEGRPGWHIECSAMASSIMGAKMDIHTGGEDLRFPHHDNELAQAEAHYHTDGCRQWVNYFLHSGHLSHQGHKMSKSLKNFKTIRAMLELITPRQMRIMFAMQAWHKGITYGDQVRNEVKAREAQFKNFFQNIEAVSRIIDQSSAPARWQADEHKLQRAVDACQVTVHEALCDNLNTAGSMDALAELIKATNVYLAEKQAAGATPMQPMLLRKAAAYATRILSCFGIVESAADRPGMSDASSSGEAGSSGPAGAAYLDAFAAFRDEVRALAKAKAEHKELMAACDRVRDGSLVDLGVRLEDRPDGKAVWKLDDPAELRAEQAARAAAVAEVARKKMNAAVERLSVELAKLTKLAELPPLQAELSKKYKVNEAGEPTHTLEGVELDGKAKEKARKDFEKAVKVREPLVKKMAEDPECLSSLAKEIQALQVQMAAL